MKKYYFLIIVALILGLVLTGCSLLSNVGQVPATGQKGMPLSTTNLLALWHFDENSGTTAYDSTDNSNNGTVSGASWVDGKLGNALSFDGIGDYVEVLDSTSLKPSSVTVECWVRSSAIKNYQYIVAKYYTGGYASYGLYTGNSGGLFFYVSDGSYSLSEDAGTGVWDGEWHHIAGTYNGSTLRLYVDGSEIGTGKSVTKTIGYSTGNLYVGSYDTGYYFTGLIDEVRIWDGALTETEISYSYADEILHVDDDWDQWPGAYYTINEALAVAGDGDTIIVEAGTYNENVTINKSVILQGGSGVILHGPGSGNGFLINAADIAIDNFEIKNFSIGIRTFGDPSNFGNLNISNVNIHHNSQNGVLIVYDIFDTVTIEDCRINSNNQNGIGIVNAATIDTLLISGTQVNQNGHHGLFLANTTITSLSIVDSNFDGSQTNGFCGITFGTTASNIGALSMTGGSLSGNKGGGLYVVQAPSQFGSIHLNGVNINNNQESGTMLGGNALTGALTVENCLLQGNGWEHIDLSGGWMGAFSVTGNTFITGNTFSSGPWCALYVGALGAFGDEVAVNQNNFLTGSWGIDNYTSNVVNATCNWWGDFSGPSGAGTGLGDAVSENVDFNPWLLDLAPNGECVFKVEIDIKPQSCPNPLNVKNQGVLPMAILGTEDFDVTEVNLNTILLEGVPPLRWAFEDVTTPSGNLIDLNAPDCSLCTDGDPDGYTDLTLKFDTQAVLCALGHCAEVLVEEIEATINNGDCLVLTLIGDLSNGEYSGYSIMGKDVVLIIKKGK